MAFDIYIAGVGGQGIGLLSQVLLRAMDLAGQTVIGVDTHGLAQRGGSVVSRIRCGADAHSPLTRQHSCQLVLGMEIHEALRGVSQALAPGGALVFLDLIWQPLPVRLGLADERTAQDVSAACQALKARAVRVRTGEVTDPRMQNMALLGTLVKERLVPGLEAGQVVRALEDLLPPSLLDRNLTLFQRYAG